MSVLAAAMLGAPASAQALDPLGPLCSAVGNVSGVAGKACKVVSHPGRVISAGKKLLSGKPGQAVKSLLGSGSSSATSSVVSRASAAVALAAMGAWVLGGAKVALRATAKVLSDTTTPQLRSTWFSSAYWRMAAIAATLTLPFLFAAAVQALMRSDLALLSRAAFGYLPLAMLAVSIAAPVTMLMLVASDQLAAIVSSAAGNAGVHFLEHAGLIVGGLTVLSGSPFLAFLVGILTATATLVLWLELLMREAAVYVVVLMLPLAFAALVWPARRIWAVRAVELLVALILSKFAIVAVLALGGGAISQVGGHSITGALAGAVLVLLGAFAPWALLRLLPLAELASGAVGGLRGEQGRLEQAWSLADRYSGRVENWAGALTAGMRRQADESTVAAPTQVNGHGAPEPESATASTGAEEPASAGAGEPARADEPEQALDTPGAIPADEPRLPGMPEIWQAQDGEWPALKLGGEDGLPTHPLWPPREPEPEPPAPPADHHDPLPPKQ